MAEGEEEGERKLIGVGRLVADADHETAEYAVLVGDRWHGHGLGGVLTDYCLEIARGWGLSRMVAETTTDNARMLALFGTGLRHHPRGRRPGDSHQDAALRSLRARLRASGSRHFDPLFVAFPAPCALSLGYNSPPWGQTHTLRAGFGAGSRSSRQFA